MLSQLCLLRGKTMLSTWDLLQSCSGPSVLMWKNIVFSCNIWMLYKVFPDFCSPWMYPSPAVCSFDVPSSATWTTDAFSNLWKQHKQRCLWRTPAQKESNQLTQAKLMISVKLFRQSWAELSLYMKKLFPYIHLNSWVFIPRCLVRLLLQALLFCLSRFNPTSSPPCCPAWNLVTIRLTLRQLKSNGLGPVPKFSIILFFAINITLFGTESTL